MHIILNICTQCHWIWRY